MTILEFPYTNLAAGATATEANTGHNEVANTPATCVVRDGYKFLRFNPVYDGVTAATGQSYINEPFAASPQFSWAGVVYLDASPSASIEVFNGRVAAAKVGNVLGAAGRTFQYRQAGDVNLGSASTAHTLGTPYLWQIAQKRGTTTSNGQTLFRSTPLVGGAALIDLANSAANLGTADFTAARWGDLTTAASIDLLVGRVRIATGADALDGTGNLKFIDPLTVSPAVYYATSSTTSVPAQMWYATSSTTSVRVDVAS